MSSPTPPISSQFNQVESWEAKEVQIRLEQAEDFAKMSPEEQQKRLAEEKVKFDSEQKKLQEELGYKKFNPEKAKVDPQQEEKEQEAKAKELAIFEGKIDKGKDDQELDLKKFKKLFDAAVENIEGKRNFPFQSVALDDFGRPVTHQAFMTELVDHSQGNKLKPAEIWSRIEKKQTLPSQISVSITVDMGEDKNNSLGLTNLSLYLSLSSLASGHIIEKLANFTNLAFFAALLHDKGKKANQQANAKADQPQPKVSELIKENYNKKAIQQVSEGGGEIFSKGLFEQSQSSAVGFSFNSGSVWGVFDEQANSSNPKELQEAIDKINTEK